ncbi:MAG: sigma-70 family RNA polymerase sigma factor [Miltoncostaeaceae bacterium]
MTRFPDSTSLFEAVARGDREAREAAILAHIPLVRSLARRHARSAEPVEDLEQVGTVALIGAVDRYDPRRGGSFVAFAVPTVTGEILRHHRDRAGSVRLPRSLGDARREVIASADRMRSEDGHEPSVSDLSRDTRLAAETVREALDAPDISRPLPYWGDEGDAGPSERVGGDDDGFAAAEARIDIEEAMEVLPARERRILHLRYREDLTQSEIAERVGLSQMHVSRLLRRAVATLGERLGAGREAVGAAG